MLKLCPQCKRLSVEYDLYHHVEKCLNKECGWVNRNGKPLEVSNFALPSMKLSAILEERNHKKTSSPQPD